MMNDIERLKNFVLAHPEMSRSGFIKGFDKETNKVVINVNGQERRITIDELESGHLNQTNAQNMVNTQPVSNQEVAPVEEIEVMEEPTTPMDEPVETLVSEPVTQSVDKPIVTLKDLKEAVQNKNASAVNKAYATFAIDEKTGVISDNKVINLVTNNSMNNVINSITNNIQYIDDLSMYDLTGKYIGTMQKAVAPQNIAELIDKSFNNILVPVEAANVFNNANITEASIISAKKQYATRINDKMRFDELKKQEENREEQKIEPDMKKTLVKQDIKPNVNIKKAGFADILILTIIVTIYAAIIINLISRLK